MFCLPEAVVLLYVQQCYTTHSGRVVVLVLRLYFERTGQKAVRRCIRDTRDCLACAILFILYYRHVMMYDIIVHGCAVFIVSEVSRSRN